MCLDDLSIVGCLRSQEKTTYPWPDAPFRAFICSMFLVMPQYDVTLMVCLLNVSEAALVIRWTNCNLFEFHFILQRRSLKSRHHWGTWTKWGLLNFKLNSFSLPWQLNGDHILNAYPDIGKSMTVGQASMLRMRLKDSWKPEGLLWELELMSLPLLQWDPPSPHEPHNLRVMKLSNDPDRLFFCSRSGLY